MKVTVRRTHPSAAACLLAFLLTALMVCLLALSARKTVRTPRVAFAAPPRVTRTLTLAGETYCFVTLGKFPGAEEARVSAARLVSRGSAGYLWRGDEGIQVLGNVYAAGKTAGDAAQRLRRQGIEAGVQILSAPARELSLTATEEQLAAFLAGRAALDRAMSALSELSRRLDAGEIDVSAAHTQALVAAYDLQSAAGPFLGASEAAPDPFILRFRALLARTLEALRDLAACDQPALYLSSRVKCALIDCALGRIAFLQA